MSMFKQQEIVCVFGLGKTGLAAARYLERIRQKFVVVDTRIAPPGADEVNQLQFCVGSIYGLNDESVWTSELKDVEKLILSPGIDPRIDLIQSAIGQNKKILSDIEIFVAESSGDIVAITGSNGKSTVTDLTYQLLKAAGEKVDIGGNFGIPVLDFLPADESDIYVLELSSFQLDITDNLSPAVATILNISEDHMDRYNTFDAYVDSKQKIYKDATKCVANLDDRLTIPSMNKSYSSFSIDHESADYRVEKLEKQYYLNVRKETLLPVEEMTISGRHNWSNALAALGILSELEIKLDERVINALKGYKGLAHRFEKVSSDSSVDWINDSKATNVGATLAAIDSIDSHYYSPVVLIAGGESKGADLTPLSDALTHKVDFVALIGKDANKIAEITQCKNKTFQSMEDAVKSANEFVKENAIVSKRGVVLLSPACASLDMYANFEVRGNEFKRCVEALR